jgi:membrane peptidoglycan carboxypeptidase
MLGGKPPARGGKLTRREAVPPSPRPQGAHELLIVVAVCCLVLGGVLGFTAAMDRQLRGGLLRQYAEAATRPDWVPLAELPPDVAAAFLAVVDPGFEEGGSLRARDEGNTIPRELIRQIHLLGSGLADEAKELVMAPVLEGRATKSEILELYLNRVQLGSTGDYPVYGVYHAAREYFGKDPRELTLSEAATLAGILLEPRIDEPQQKAGAVGIRRNEVLSVQQYQAAVAERLGFQPGIAQMPMSRRLPAPTDTVATRLTVDLPDDRPATR